jgi:hypothetical protein
LLAAAALAAEVAAYVHERRRLTVVQRLSGPAGRDVLEATARGAERLMLVVTALLVASAAAALAWPALAGGSRP